MGWNLREGNLTQTRNKAGSVALCECRGRNEASLSREQPNDRRSQRDVRRLAEGTHVRPAAQVAEQREVEVSFEHDERADDDEEH